MPTKKKAKTPTEATLRSAAIKADEAAGAAADDVRKAMQRFFKRYIAQFKGRLTDLGMSEAEQISLREQTELVKDLRRIAADAGFADVVEQYNKQLARIGQNALQYFSDMDLSPALGGTDKEAINIMAEGFIDDLGVSVDKVLLRPLERSIIQTNIPGRSRAEVVREMVNIIDSNGILKRDGSEWTSREVDFLLYDSERRFQEQVRHTKAAGLDLAVVVYTGPLDKVTRPACEFLLTEAPHGVAGMYYVDEVNSSMHEDLTGNPLVERGGYNCRHSFMPLSLDAAISMGFQADKGNDE